MNKRTQEEQDTRPGKKACGSKAPSAEGKSPFDDDLLDDHDTGLGVSGNAYDGCGDDADEMQNQASGHGGRDMRDELDLLLQNTKPAQEQEQDQLLLELENAYSIPEEKLGPAVNPKLGEMINGLFTKVMPDDKIKLIEEKLLKPENCPNVCSARVNQEIWDCLPAKTKINDMGLAKLGAKVAKGATQVITVLDSVYQARVSDTPLDNAAAIRGCMDALAVFGTTVHDINMMRRNAIKKELPQKTQKLVNKVKEESPLLFGNDLQKQLREMAETEKLGLGTASSYKARFPGSSFPGSGKPNFRGYGAQGRGRGGSTTYRSPLPAHSTPGEWRWGEQASRNARPFQFQGQGKKNYAYRSHQRNPQTKKQ